MSSITNKEISAVIKGMSKAKREYETDRALKKGFKNLEEYQKFKLESEIKTSVKSENEKQISKERKIWKKTQGDIWTEYKGTSTGYYPYFDINYYTSQNPDFVEGVSTETSKEMD